MRGAVFYGIKSELQIAALTKMLAHYRRKSA